MKLAILKTGYSTNSTVMASYPFNWSHGYFDCTKYSKLASFFAVSPCKYFPTAHCSNSS